MKLINRAAALYATSVGVWGVVNHQKMTSSDGDAQSSTLWIGSALLALGLAALTQGSRSGSQQQQRQR